MLNINYINWISPAAWTHELQANFITLCQGGLYSYSMSFMKFVHISYGKSFDPIAPQLTYIQYTHINRPKHKSPKVAFILNVNRIVNKLYISYFFLQHKGTKKKICKSQLTSFLIPASFLVHRKRKEVPLEKFIDNFRCIKYLEWTSIPLFHTFMFKARNCWNMYKHGWNYKFL